ncbi:TPA: hypothetical protein ACH3X1_000178 [Trebouxia sp. C0004]
MLHCQQLSPRPILKTVSPHNLSNPKTYYNSLLLHHPFPHASSCPAHSEYSKLQDLATPVSTCFCKVAQLPAKQILEFPLRIWSKIHMQLPQHGPFAIAIW